MGGAIFRDYNFNRSINKSLRPPPAAGPDIRWIRKKRRKNGKKEIKKGRNAARDSPNARRLSSAISLRISERIVRIVRDVDKGEPLSTVVECRCLTMP